MSGRLPSIASRLARALLAWSLAWGLAAGAAVWLSAGHEVDELLDETLAASAQLLVAVLQHHDPAAGTIGDDATIEHFAWQLVDPEGRVRLRAQRAPAVAWQTTPRAGYSEVDGWRLYGLATGREGLMLYAAQTAGERGEARIEVALSAVLAALAIGALGHLWLRARVRAELTPLQTLSSRLGAWPLEGPAGRPAPLGAAERAELAPVHAAVDELGNRLAERLATERAFAAHAAHALRTPLAGIDAQLAVAVREAPPALAARLQRVRGAATRLQSVVSALLALFRSAGGQSTVQAQWQTLESLASRLPLPGLQVITEAGASVRADPDLLAAALSNLLDNALRHGARTVHLTALDGGLGLRLHDDGPGAPPQRLAALRAAFEDSSRTDPAVAADEPVPSSGLGLLLAARVARAHGGSLRLPDSTTGFCVELRLAPTPNPGPQTGGPEH